MPTEEELQAGFSLGEWDVVPGHGILRRGDEEKRPEPKVFAVLIALAKRDTNLVTKQELIDEVWEGRPTSDEPIARCISQLRGHLDDRQTPHQYVETLQRRGYRLVQSVELKRAAPAVEAVADTITVPAPRPRPWKLIAGLIVAAIAAVELFIWFGPEPERSIAIMPFENLSDQPADEYLVLGFKEELVHVLQGLDNYTVKNGRVAYDMESDDIAELLGVESVLFGSLRRNGDRLKINYRISADGEVVLGETIEGDVADLFELQEALAAKVRSSLTGASEQTLIKSRPSDSDAYDSYMRGIYALEHRGTPGNSEKAIELFQYAIQQDEAFGPSYLALATAYVVLPSYSNAPRREMYELALQTIATGVRADPLIEDAAGSIYGFVYHQQKRWDESEDAYLRAINARVVDANAFNWYSRMLASVGRLDESLEQALKGLELDPSSPSLNSRVAMAYAWTMQTDTAMEYYERSADLGWSGVTHMLSYSFMLLRTGRLDVAEQFALGAAEKAGNATAWVRPAFAALADPAKAPEALAALDDESMSRGVGPLVQLTLRALLGDLDGAMRVAESLDGDAETFEMDLLFAPELKAFRQHPDFMPLLERLGVTGYWKRNGCTWSADRVICKTD